jgi:hypothetical protein
MQQVASAIEQRDRYEFEKYVDIDSVLQSLVVDASGGNALAAAVGGALVTQLRPQVLKAIEDGKVPTDNQFTSGLNELVSGRGPEVEKQGRNAYFSMHTKTRGGNPFTLKVHLTQVPDGYWRIDRIANVAELRAEEGREEQERKAALARANEEVLKTLVVAAKLHTSVRSGYGGWNRKNRFQLRFEHQGKQQVKEVVARITFAKNGFDKRIKGEIDIPPGGAEVGTWEIDVNQFMADTEAVYALGETENFEVVVQSVVYEDGTRVSREEES